MIACESPGYSISNVLNLSGLAGNGIYQDSVMAESDASLTQLKIAPFLPHGGSERGPHYEQAHFPPRVPMFLEPNPVTQVPFLVHEIFSEELNMCVETQCLL